MAPGKTAPRLVQDLLVYDPRYEERAGRNLLTSPPPHFDPNKSRSAAVPFRNCRHTLLVKHEQSQPPSPGEDVDHETLYKIAAYCQKCRWHFDVIVDFRTHDTTHKPCKNGDEDYMLHHFLFEEESSQHDANGLGAQFAPRTYNFRCSAPPCPVRLQIRIKPPHFSDQDIETLTNQAQLRRRWEVAKQLAGDRADANMARRADGPDFLYTYLSDALNPVRGKARIPLLNKKFLKTFGKDCDTILNRLGFSKQLEEEDVEIAEVWYLPRPEEPTDLFETSLRTTIEDARYELNTIILEIPENERIGARHTPLFPPPAGDLIERALGCNDYLKAPGRAATRSTNQEEDHPYYASLGGLADFADELILFAFSRQVAVDSDNYGYYYECLQDLAQGRQSETLGMQVAMLGSQGITSRREADAAYRYFGIEPAHIMHINDEHIIGVFKSRLSDMSPSMAEETRRQLRVIGDARNSDVIRSEAAGALETYQQALSWLDLDESQADDFIPTMFTLKTQDNPSSLETARKAVSLIAEHRNSQRLRQFLHEGTMTAPEMDIGEAYALFSISDRTAKVDFDVMKTMMTFGQPESAEKMQKAYEMIEQDQAQNFNNRSNQSVVRRNNYPLESWPVGLRNIGNTCYLNSVLQFLFTIKPLRDLVLNCDDHLQDPSPEALKGKKVGRTAVTAERVEVAQKFVHELRTFFQYMITAPTDTVQPAIDLAALALCKTDMPQTAPQSPKLATQTGEGLGSIEGIPISGPALPPTETVTATNDTTADSVMGDDKSDTSMQAMDLQDQSSETEPASKPAPPTRPPPVPPRPAPQAPQGKSRLGNIEESARQQDAAEVLSNIFDLFSCAIKGEGVLGEDEQFDTIKRLFFSDVISVRNTEPKPEQTNELRDHFLVSPGWRDRNLYATLDDDFGLSEMDGGITKYDSIKTAAPIQIINLRRLQFDRAKGEQVYDRSHIGLEPTLYLDRYLMETQTLPQLELLRLRQAQWEKQRQLRAFDERRDQLRKTDFEGLDVPDILEETSAFIKDLSDQYSEQTPEKRFLPTPPPELADNLLAKSAQLKQELSDIDSRMTELETEINQIFSSSHDHPYRLHSVFTHRGGTKGGHYWIYIYDFQNGMWRKYNDDQVTVADEKDIFEREKANIPPASTGVVYIRADLVDDFTQAVCRVPEVDKPDDTQDSDVTMADPEPVRYNDVKVIDGVDVQRGQVKRQKFTVRERRGRMSLPPPAQLEYAQLTDDEEWESAEDTPSDVDVDVLVLDNKEMTRREQARQARIELQREIDAMLERLRRWP